MTQSGTGHDPSATEYLPQQPGEPTIVYVREKPHWGRRLLVFIGVTGLVVASVIALSAVNLLPNFLRNPLFEPHVPKQPPLRAPLPWRPDGAALRPEVQRLALEFGYQY